MCMKELRSHIRREECKTSHQPPQQQAICGELDNNDQECASVCLAGGNAFKITGMTGPAYGGDDTDQ